MPLVLATFNVKDLFDAAEPVARAQLEDKLDVLAAKVAAADADVLALQEVGSAEVLRAMCARLPGGGGYGEPLLGTADARGIRCAILSRRPVIASRVHVSAQLRRGVLQADIDGGELGLVHAFVMHFKSNRPVLLGPPAASQILRVAEASFVRALVSALIESHPGCNLAVMGDLNDSADSIVVQILCGAGPSALRQAAETIPANERFSNFHHGVRCQIDHMLLSPSLRSRVRSARFLNADLRDHSGILDDQPTADSDHAPLVVRLE